MKVNDYDILCASTLIELKEDVKDRINLQEGWSPVGAPLAYDQVVGYAGSIPTRENGFAQAMVQELDVWGGK